METLLSIAVALCAGLLVSRFVKPLKLPAVTGYLIAGILIGPYCLGRLGVQGLGFPTTGDVKTLSLFNDVALGFIAFAIGNEFRLSQLRHTGKQATVIGIFQAVTATLVVDVVLIGLHYFVLGDAMSIADAIVLGAIATATAPAATLMVVRQYKAKGELTDLLLPIVALDDAVGLVVFAISFGVASSTVVLRFYNSFASGTLLDHFHYTFITIGGITMMAAFVFMLLRKNDGDSLLPGRKKPVFETTSSQTYETAPVEAAGGTAIPKVEFVDAGLTYAEAKESSIEGLSLKVKRGETIGIIGGTGSGKSTLVNLIPRFYDVTSGNVVIDGNNVKEYPFSQLRKKVGMVPQQAVLFKGTIRDNMKWGKEDASEEEIQRALSIAQASGFVKSKPEGLNTMVSQGGANLSGGQRQRLTIARALVGDPEILIMDDSASALDFATDAALRHAIHEQTKGMTVFIVSQRATSIKQADKILVLDDGELAGVGTHKELMESCEVYREICLSQLSEQEVNR